MALSQRLEFRQSQALVMTPQLMQAIKLLQLSSLDLAAYVEGELERNPLLERASDDDGPPPGGDADLSALGSDGDSSGDGGGDGDSGATPDWIGADLETSRSSMEQGLGTELENVFPDDGGEKTAAVETPPPAYTEWSGSGTGGEDGDYNLEAFVTAEITLADHLSEQMALAIHDPAQRMIGAVPDRYGRRDRLSDRRLAEPSPTSSAVRWLMLRRCWRCCRRSTRPASAPAA